MDPKAILFKKANEWKLENIFSDSDDTFAARSVVDCFEVKACECNSKVQVTISQKGSLNDSINCVTFYDKNENSIVSFSKNPKNEFSVITTVEKENFCVGGTMIAEVQLNNGNSLRVAVPITISGTISDIPEPESLMKLVKEWKCINVIPRCKTKKFINSNDDVYRRLRACIASYGAAEKETIYEKCRENIKKLCEALNQNNEPVYMNDEEKSYLERLAKFLYLQNFCNVMRRKINK